MGILEPVLLEEKSSFEGFHIRLKTLRKSKNIKVEEMSELLEIAPSTYQGYEFNKRFPSLEKLHLITKALNTSSDYLLGLTDNPEPKDPPEDLIEWITSKEFLKVNGVEVHDKEIREQLKKSFEMTFLYYNNKK